MSPSDPYASSFVVDVVFTCVTTPHSVHEETLWVRVITVHLCSSSNGNNFRTLKTLHLVSVLMPTQRVLVQHIKHPFKLLTRKMREGYPIRAIAVESLRLFPPL